MCYFPLLEFSNDNSKNRQRFFTIVIYSQGCRTGNEKHDSDEQEMRDGMLDDPLEKSFCICK